MFVEAREKIVKCIVLAKCIKCDIEKWSTFNEKLKKSLISVKVNIIKN